MVAKALQNLRFWQVSEVVGFSLHLQLRIRVPTVAKVLQNGFTDLLITAMKIRALQLICFYELSPALMPSLMYCTPCMCLTILYGFEICHVPVSYY